MEYIYSAMILHSAGKEITEDAVGKILKAAGVEPDTARVKALTASLEGVDIAEAMKTAMAAPVAAAAPSAAPAAVKKEEPEEEKVSEEEAAAGLGALFG
ncbi:MAG: 50S ribosomal protein P1 [Candidatus Thermoplasmatota archaeon]|nr:50S ribosomal protein P1 [Euryarchaeota archaeon]MBU4032392.1 50S ribosomal protein P1 [Candidatus Thermoplasmatota archaeon]MBU4071016.1 50S ribosomal protein P1 [Candidatus Thermoplasmatota archaeon]MBU4144817.1 50S ribosomal protein P1 [Candidatus Thermoplasmatota archaeon]MBU4591820.1 50S ribosomal protein P1 [Candidatus Thermoplasmatota archaeon]